MPTFSYFGKEALLGGLNTSDNPLILRPAELTQADNISITQSLARRKRPGQVTYHTGSYAGTASYPQVGKPIRGIVQYWRTISGTGEREEDIFLHSDTKVWSIANRTAPALNRTGSLTLTDSGIPSYQVFTGQLYFCSTTDSDGYNKWDARPASPSDATSVTAPADGPGKYLSTFGGRMVMSGNADFPFRVYISAALNAELWSGMDSTSFDLDYDNDPEGVTAIFGELEGRLYIATRRTIYELTASDPGDVATFIIRPVTRGIGCVGPRMFAQTASKDILFWSDRGLHSLRKVIVSDQTEITFFSREVQKTYTEQVNTSLLSQGQLVWDETQNLAITTLPSAGQLTNDVVLVYNITFGVWTVWNDVDARSMEKVLLNNKQYVLCGREDGVITYLDPSMSTDQGSGFSARFKTGKIFPGGDITNEKTFKNITILASAESVSTVNITATIDGIDGTKQVTKGIQLAEASSLLGSTFVLGASTLGIGRFIPVTLSIEETGYNIQIDVSVSGDADIEFYGFTMEVEGANAFIKG